MNPFRTVLRPAALVAVVLLCLAVPARSQHAGYRTLTIPGDASTTVALFYPTASAERAVPMGPWLPVVAPGAPVSEAKLKGLILISHGTGGTELNHHNLGTRLARDGYLVAAVRHEGDNWQDRSLVTSGRYFSERPLQISRMLDALLASPVSVPDRRIRAVVVMAPMAVVFTPESLAAITVPVRVIVAERDVVLNGGYHGGHVVASLPRAQASSVAGAGHFAFMAQPTFPLPSAAGDAAANPAGFDRSAFLPELENQVAGFFAEQWR